MKRKRHTGISILALLIAILLSVNLSLWLLDPLGLLTYLDDLEQLWSQRTPTDEGYVLADRVYVMRGYTATIKDGNRIMPLVQDTDCTIAFVGDSVTFAMGVNDHESFAYQLALALPAIQFINEAMPAYNVTNNRHVIEASNADGFILISIHNDDQKIDRFDKGFKRTLYALPQYWQYLNVGFGGDYTHDLDTYYQDMEVIQAHDDVLIIGFNGDNLLDDTGALLLSYPVDTVSKVDGHPNAMGHANLTKQMLVPVTTFIERVCN